MEKPIQIERIKLLKSPFEFIAPTNLARFVGGQLEITPSIGPLRRGEISSIALEEQGFCSCLKIEFAWSVVSEGDVLDYKRWNPEENPEVVEIPLLDDLFVQVMDMERIFIVTQPIPGFPKRHLFMTTDCGTLEAPKKR